MTYGLLDQPLHVTDKTALEELSRLLHDETCDVEDMVWDQQENTLLLPVRRQFHDGEEVVIESDGEWATYEKDWMWSEVLIRHIKNLEIQDDQEIGCYGFLRWELEKNLLNISFCQVLVLLVSIEKLDITIRDIGFRGKARIQRRIRGGSEISSYGIY